MSIDFKNIKAIHYDFFFYTCPLSPNIVLKFLHSNTLFCFFYLIISTLYFNHLISVFSVNLLKPTGHVMHQQFNIQQLYVLPTLYLCVLYLSENKQRLVPFTA